MLNPIALTRIAGCALALSLAASCSVESSNEVAPAGTTTGTAEAGEGADPKVDAQAGAEAGAEAEAQKEDAPETPDMGSGADVSTWKTGGTIPSGIPGVKDIEILELRNNGSGPVCGNGKSATVKYKAMLADGTVKDPGPEYTFQVGAGRVIKGWDVIIAKMRVGDSMIVKIPEGLAYPRQGDWKFEMELLSFK